MLTMLAEDENNCFNKIRQTLHTMKMMIYIYPSKFSKHKRYSSLFMDDEDDNLIKIRQILQRQQTLTMFAEHFKSKNGFNN